MEKTMKAAVALFTVLLGAMPIVGAPVFAEENFSAEVTDVGNKQCPVTGEAVSGKDFVTYQGKSYGLCCLKCRGPFLNDPEKYITPTDVKEKETPEQMY